MITPWRDYQLKLIEQGQHGFFKQAYIEPVGDGSPRFISLDKVSIFQNTEMFRHGGRRVGEPLPKFACCLVSVPQQFKFLGTGYRATVTGDDFSDRVGTSP